MRPHLVVLLLMLPAVAGCLQDEPPRVPPLDGDTDDPGAGNGDGNGDGDDPPTTEGGLVMVLESTNLTEGGTAVLSLKNEGSDTLAGSLVVDLVDPNGVVIARSEQTATLPPGSTAPFSWQLPSFLEDGTYTWNASIGDGAASASATVDGTAFPGEGPPAHDAEPWNWNLIAETGSRSIFYPKEDILLTLRNTGTGVAVGPANVTLHHAPDGIPEDRRSLPALVARVVDLDLAPGASLTLPPFQLPASQVPADTPEYYFHVEWRHGTATTNFFLENRTLRPDPHPGPLGRTYTADPPRGWSGNVSITLEGATHGAWLHYATDDDIAAGNASPSLASTATYRNTILSAFTTAWATYTTQGWTMPEVPIHVYLDHPGGKALGTAQQTDYGAHVVIGPQTLHDDADADVRSTASHELFHVVQVNYDLQEGFLVEGTAAWAEDKPHDTLDYLGHARQFLNEPDRAPLQFREYELSIFLYWVEDTYGFAAVKAIVENSTHYDNEEAVEKALNASFDDLWVDFLHALAARDVRNADELFQKPQVFGLRAWKWIYDDAPTRLSDEAANRTLNLSLSVSHEELGRMMDADVGRVRHAYGFDAFNLTADLSVDPAGDDVNLTFEGHDADSTYVVLLARHDGDGWNVTALDANEPTLVTDVKDTWTIVVVARLASGTGTYDLVMTPA